MLPTTLMTASGVMLHTPVTGMLVNCPVERSPPLHVYAAGDGAALAILVVPTNPQVTAAHDTNTAAPNRVRNFTFSAFRRLCRPRGAVTHREVPPHRSLLATTACRE